MAGKNNPRGLPGKLRGGSPKPAAPVPSAQRSLSGRLEEGMPVKAGASTKPATPLRPAPSRKPPGARGEAGRRKPRARSSARSL